MEVAFLGLLLLFVPFALPIIGWVSARRTKRRVAALELLVAAQTVEIERLVSRLARIEGGAPEAPLAASQPVRNPPAVPQQEEPGSPRSPEPRATVPFPTSEPVLEPVPVEGIGPPVWNPPFESTIEDSIPAASLMTDTVSSSDVAVPPAAAAPPQPPRAPFDWESLVGVKLFSAIAGIALVIAAVSFLRYSVEHGWLQPPVRVLIGIAVAIGLLAVCELKAARRYPATANALDGAAIAILFATFFAAHALWNLIPSLVAFVLLAIVTALAVLLSIRRESLFIAVLGLIGGFATPALLSSGENQPIPLFAYLLLLNVGLSWVAYRQVWPVLTWLTLGLTTLYQVLWVLQFLADSSLPLAMGIFLVFPLAAAIALSLAGPGVDAAAAPGPARTFQRTALLSAGVPLLFAAYLASVPAYGANAALLLGFLLLIDAGLLAIALARGMPVLHAAGGLATLVVLAVWLSTSYVIGDGRVPALAFTAAFTLFFLAAPAIARRFGRPFAGVGRSGMAAPLLLFVFPALAVVEPAFARPAALFLTLLPLLLIIAWRAVVEDAGRWYFTASFFAVATQAVWSARYLTQGRLGAAVAIYAAFGVASMAIPVIARRLRRALQPSWGGGAVLLASLVLLGFVSLGPVSTAALWALGLLLAIMNAGLFVESASARLPYISQAGSLLSWALLGIWWTRAAGSVGVLPSLIVMTGLTLVTLAGHAWASWQGPEEGSAPARATSVGQGLYLALLGHLFLVFIAANRAWSLPPWPLFGALAVMTLGTSAVSLFTRTASLHAAGVVGAALVVASWAGAAGGPEWGVTVVIASASVSAYALGWIRFGGVPAARAACAVLFLGELAVLSASGGGARPPFPAELLIHLANLAAILGLTSRYRWRFVAIAAIAPAGLAILPWLSGPALSQRWGSLLLLSGGIYLLFVAYPLYLGRRAKADRDPYTAAVLASALFFFAARHAFHAAGLSWAIGVIPVGEAAVLALLMRSLLGLESSAERDMGRLALVAGSALAFVTVAIPLQLDQQWITIGWALEGAALAWLFRRIPHRGLLYAGTALLLAMFVRLALNPEVLLYEPRGALRILNWYLYTYAICSAAMLAAGWWCAGTSDRLIAGLPRVSALLPGGAVILLFLLLNIEIADFYSTGPTITFRFGATVSQDLTYTIAWLVFGMLLLAAGIYARNRPARVTAVALIAVTAFKCFLYDLASLGGLYRVASFVGLALALALVSLALQKYVLAKPAGRA